jgi:hypothetical protein
MSPSIFVSTVWLLCMVAAVAHGARKLSGVGDIAQLVLGFGLTFAAAIFLSPQPGWIGFLAAVFAGWRLIHKGDAGIDRVLGGVSAALGGALYAGYGLNVWIAAASAAMVLAIGVWLAQSQRPSTAPVREAALATVALGAVLAGLAPEVATGWRSALILNKTPPPAHVVAIPGWALAFVSVALLAGVVRGFWVRRPR